MRSLKIAVGFATTGRREILSEAVGHVARQTRPPDLIVVRSVKPGDVDRVCLAGFGLPIEILHGAAGLPHQRNVILDRLAEFDVVVFFDDDFLARQDYIEAVERIFCAAPDVVMLTGTLLADGARNAGVPLDTGRALLARSPRASDATLEEVFGAYGCNMALRLAPALTHSVQFNEDLPLYAWLEDLDFSRRMARYGRIVRSRELQGVHLAVKSGRVSGVRFGYSQVANPVELYRAGLIPITKVISHAGRNLASNLIRSLVPEVHIDRRGRLRGNIRALADLARGRLTPRAILDM